MTVPISRMWNRTKDIKHPGLWWCTVGCLAGPLEERTPSAMMMWVHLEDLEDLEDLVDLEDLMDQEVRKVSLLLMMDGL